VQVGTRSFNFPSSKWTFARIGEVTSGADHIMDVLTPNLTHLTEGGREHGLESYRGNKTP